MGNTYFEVLDESSDGGRYLAGPTTAGPWDPGKQHGGPPNALLVRAAERLAGGAGLVAMRLAAEFLTPVPIAELVTRARVVRGGRTVALVAVTLATPDGTECLQARVWLVRPADTAAVAMAPATPPSGPPSGPPSAGLDFPCAHTIDWHPVRGSMHEPGPAALWARPQQPLVEGEQLSGLQRAALIGDSASGLSAELDWARWSFPNVDLDIHLARPLRGEWLYLDTATQVGDQGVALARSSLADVYGPVGATAQTLIVRPRR